MSRKVEKTSTLCRHYVEKSHLAGIMSMVYMSINMSTYVDIYVRTLSWHMSTYMSWHKCRHMSTYMSWHMSSYMSANVLDICRHMSTGVARANYFFTLINYSCAIAILLVRDMLNSVYLFRKSTHGQRQIEIIHRARSAFSGCLRPGQREKKPTSSGKPTSGGHGEGRNRQAAGKKPTSGWERY